VGGLRSPDFYGLALALGGSEIRLDELVRLYAMLAGGGVDRDLILTRGQVPGRATRLLSPEASFLVLDMLRSNPRPGDEMTPATARRREPVAWKTGTSFGFRDAWAAGIVGRYALGVWVGNFDGTPNPAFVGPRGGGPALLRHRRRAPRARASERRRRGPPSGLVRVEVCALSGAPAGPHCPGHTPTWVIAGRSPIATCSIHRDVAIDVATGLRACPDQHDGVRHESTSSGRRTSRPSSAASASRAAQPPPYAPSCQERSVAGRPLRIDSPQPRLVYALRDGEHDEIPFSAVADADGRRVSWFVDDAYVGQSEPAARSSGPRARPLRAARRRRRRPLVAQPLAVELVSDGRLPAAHPPGG
jgi:penicillin-binding protein 1C